MDGWGVFGTVASVVGAGISIWQAKRAITAKAAAEAARDEINEGNIRHQRAESLSELVKKLEHATVQVRPFSTLSPSGAKGRSRDAAVDALTDASVALSESMTMFDVDDRERIRVCLVTLDVFSRQYSEATSDNDRDSLLQRTFKNIRDIKSIAKGELQRSRIGG